MLKSVVCVLVALLLVSWSGPAFAVGNPPMETIKGKVVSVDTDAKKIRIDDKEYELHDDVLSVDVKVGDQVEADVVDDVVRIMKKVSVPKP